MHPYIQSKESQVEDNLVNHPLPSIVYIFGGMTGLFMIFFIILCIGNALYEVIDASEFQENAFAWIYNMVAASFALWSIGDVAVVAAIHRPIIYLIISMVSHGCATLVSILIFPAAGASESMRFAYASEIGLLCSTGLTALAFIYSYYFTPLVKPKSGSQMVLVFQENQPGVYTPIQNLFW